MQSIETNMIGELLIMKQMKIKPNFSDLSRRYGLDRHTIKKYYYEGGIPIKKPIIRKGKIDKYDNEIKELLENPSVTCMAAYKFLENKYGSLDFTYGGLKERVRVKKLRCKKKDQDVHLRYETEIGEQLQVDWKEDLKITTVDGEVIEYNLFAATLGYSRYHIFIYSKTKTMYDFMRCLIECFRMIGGIPKVVLTDNMSAIVSITSDGKRKHEEILQFEKDLGIKIKLCKVRTPETKGKVESSNRFAQWLIPYDNKLKNEQELLDTINTINRQCNEKINDTTGIPPIKLFTKEKEHLLPIPSKILFESYIKDVKKQIVPATLLVQYKGKGYSVPSKLIGHEVKLVPQLDKLYVYSSTKLEVIHTITDQKMNYQLEHYVEGMKKTIKNCPDDVEQMALKNLERLARIK